MSAPETPQLPAPTPSTDPGPSDGGPRMGFLEHLDELRKRLFRASLYALVGFSVAFYFADQILDFLVEPLRTAMGGHLTVIRPAEAFINKFKAAFWLGLILALPALFYELWRFISPGLYRKEKRWVVPVMTVGSALFLAGAAFCYWIVIPPAAAFLAGQGAEFEQHITVDAAFGFSTKLLLGLGLMFEMPLVVFALARLGLVSSKFLWDKKGIAVFLIFLISAILTPTPDIMTMTVFAMPLLILYFLSIIVAWVFRRK